MPRGKSKETSGENAGVSEEFREAVGRENETPADVSPSQRELDANTRNEREQIAANQRRYDLRTSGMTSDEVNAQLEQEAREARGDEPEAPRQEHGGQVTAEDDLATLDAGTSDPETTVDEVGANEVSSSSPTDGGDETG